MQGGPYNIPRNTKGEGRFFKVFSGKALIATIGVGTFGLTFSYPIAKIIGNNAIWVVTTAICGGIGFVITSFKIPNSDRFEITRKTGGEYIYEIILRYIKFKSRNNRIYINYTEEKKDERSK